MQKSYSEIIKEGNRILIYIGDLNAIGNFFSSDYTVHVTGRSIKGGHNTVRRILTELQKSLSDIHDVDILIEGVDRVAWQRTLRGTHAGKFKGFPASNLNIIWRDMVTSRFHDGLIAEEWVVTDLAEQLLLSRKQKQ